MDQETLLFTMLASGLAHCTVTIENNGSLLVSLFMAGFLGSASHCIGMCGPFVLSQTSARLEAIPASGMSEFSRLRGAALVPYHLGRMTTYVGLGVAAAFLAGGMISFSGLNWLSALLLMVAALFFLGYALKKWQVALPGFGASSASPVSRWWSQRLGPLFASPLGWRGYGLGLGLGFLPCGLLYGGLAAAGASADPLAGGFAMIAFALGTIPSLVMVGLVGHTAGQRWKEVLNLVAPVLLVVNAGVLTYLAWSLVA